jgi:hypothetical protein
MLRADAVENLHEAVAGARPCEVATPAITTESDEVEIVASVKAPESVAHGKVPTPQEKSKPAPLNGTRVRHPRVHLLPTKDNKRMIYSIAVFRKD